MTSKEGGENNLVIFPKDNIMEREMQATLRRAARVLEVPATYIMYSIPAIQVLKQVLDKMDEITYILQKQEAALSLYDEEEGRG